MSFELAARIKLDQSDYITGLDQAKHAAHKFGEAVGEHVGEQLNHLKGQFAALFGAEMLKEGVERLVEMGHHIETLSERTGVSIHDVQALGYAAERTGANVEDVTNAFKKLAMAKEKATQHPDGEQATAFRKFGIGMDEVKGKTQVQLFMDIVRVIRESGDATAYTAQVMELMGRNADTLIPAMSEGFDELMARFEQLNLAIDDETVKSLANAKKAWAELKAEIAKDSAPLVAGLFEGIQRMLEMVKAGFHSIKHEGLFDVLDFDKAAAELLKAWHEEDKKQEEEAERKKRPPTPAAAAEKDILHDFGPRKQAIGKMFSAGESFDSLARIGGFSAQTDNMKTYQLGQSILQAVQQMNQVLQGNFSGGEISML